MNYGESTFPGWIGFNHNVTTVEPLMSIIGYLSIVDAIPTEISTLLTILEQSLQIADKLAMDTVVVVMDQARYAKAQIISWGNKLFMERLVLRLGAFHTAMNYMACIGKRFKDARLQDIAIESLQLQGL